MIISISGKIGSGKDTVGNIMHYLINKHKGYSTGEFDVNLNYSIGFSGFETKKFAYKLKFFAAELIGCSVEQLEDREFKESYLSKEWNYVDEHGFKKQMRVRDLLQKLGTEAMRDGLHEDVWVNALMCDYKKICTVIASKNKEDEGQSIYPNWIITDTRFPNELAAIKQRGGITIRVIRSNQCVCVDDSSIDCLINCDNKKSTHPSETALDDATFDYEIVNDGSIEELISKVEKILIKENLL